MNSRSIQLALFDVDGVLTDGCLYVGPMVRSLKNSMPKMLWQLPCLKFMVSRLVLFLGKRIKRLIFTLSSWILITLLPVVVISCLRSKCY
jgi:hypothetical protein